MPLKRSMLRTLKRIDRWVARINRTVKEWLGLKPNWPVLILPYRGYVSGQRLVLRGRVLKDRRILKDEVNSSWRALMNNYKRFNSREVAGAAVHINAAGHTLEAVTDEEGYFIIDTQLPAAFPSGGPQWKRIQLELHATPNRQVYATANGKVLAPGPEAEFGCISDIDDTVLKTDVTSLLKLRVLYHTLLKTAPLRQSFNQAAPFFQGLRNGLAGRPVNPFFYVSNSPWNLYDLLEEFLSLNELPDGPILLRDFGLPYQDHPEGYLGHKHSSILNILETYPGLPFVLIGDSGERDPYIYEAVARSHPGRIKAIYIRDVRSISRARKLKRFIAETGADIQLVQNYREAALHAVRYGLMLPAGQ